MGPQPHLGPHGLGLAPSSPTRSRITYTLNLHEKLTPEACRVHLSGAAIPTGLHVSRKAVYGRGSRLYLNETRGGAGRKDQGDDPGRQGPPSTASISPEIRVAGHEHRNAVKHVFQARFELPVPPVLGKSRRQAVHRGETPSVNLV